MTEDKPDSPSPDSPIFPASPQVAPPARPAGDPRLRQQIVRRVVADNLAERQGQPAARDAPSRRAARPLAAATLLAVALAATLGVFAWLDRTPETATVPAPGAASDSPPAAAPELTTTELKPIGADVLGLGVHRILLDPGHGGSDTGTVGGGLSEKDLTLDIALRVRGHLQKAGFEVHMTRTSDLALTLRERSEMANLLGAHLFVSVHLNYLPGSRTARGVETYFVGHTDDPELLELARRENANSGYDMASNNQLLQKLFSDARQQNSRSLATRVQQVLYSSLKPGHPELVDRGVKQAPFVVLVGTTMPAILAEVACLSSTQDMELLARPLYRESIAEALARGIRRYADDMNPSQKKGS